MLMHVTGRVDCFGCMCLCVCPPDSKIKHSVFYVYLCSCIILCYFTSIFYAVVRQISVLFIDNKDSVCCISNSMNSLPFKAVQDFIAQSGRFAME